jgi:hypothetical protein
MGTAIHSRDSPGNGFGFRQQAWHLLYVLARPNKTKKWVLDADIRGAFDNISHDHLLRAIGPVPGKLPQKPFITWTTRCTSKQNATPGRCTPTNPKHGDTRGIGVASIWIEMIPGCLETSSQEGICSSSDGSRLNGTRWSKEPHHPMTHDPRTTGRNGRPLKPTT